MANTRSTRSRLRSASRSQPQSQSQSLLHPCRRRTRLSLDRDDAGGPHSLALAPAIELQANRIHEDIGESFASVSTATLPPNHAVHVTLDANVRLTTSQEERLLVRGEELLTDGWRQDNGVEGRLSDLRAQRRNRWLKNKRDEESHKSLSVAKRPIIRAGPSNLERNEDILWYTAGLQYPCTCELKWYSHAWTPRVSPPILNDLPEYGHSSALVGDAIPAWSVNPAEELDPDMSSITDFEHSWQLVHGQALRMQIGNAPLSSQSASSIVTAVDHGSESSASRRLRKGKYKAGLEDDNCDRVQILRDLHRNTTLVPHNSAHGHVISSRGQVIDIEILNEGPTGDHIVRSKHYGLNVATKVKTVASHSSQLNIRNSLSIEKGKAPMSDTDKRKAWWRNDIRSSDKYGQIWAIIPRPHTLDYNPPIKVPKGPKRDRKKNIERPSQSVPEDFVLPKYYSSIPPSTPQHPFIVDLASYIRSNPRERVYWLVPVHGPVQIPGYVDQSTSAPPRAPIPSNGFLLPSSDIASLEWQLVKPQKKDELAPSSLGANNTVTSTKTATSLRWTPELLGHFWQAFLVPLQANLEKPLGNISIKVSGPKPDPFIDFAATIPPLVGDTGFGRVTASGDGTNERKGVTVEAGDHLRIYVDAKYALKLRTWLRSIEIERKNLPSISKPSLVGEHGLADGRGHGRGHGRGQDVNTTRMGVEEILKPFSKMRLTLVGMSGKVLVAA